MILHGQAMYRGRSQATNLLAASLIVLELFIGLSGADTMNLCPLGHSYSYPMKTFTVILLSTGSSGPLRLALLAAFSMMFGHFSFSSAVESLVNGTSHGNRNLELDMKPGCAPSPEEWEYR